MPVFGSGGFEQNAQMRDKYQQQPINTMWTVGSKDNTGDGIWASEKVGAALDLMDDSWWGPTIPPRTALLLSLRARSAWRTVCE